MARTLTVEVREAYVERLTGDAAIQAIGASVFGPETPSPPPWPFVRVEPPVIVPDFDGCSQASRYRINVSCFAKGEDEGPCARLTDAVAAALDGFEIVIASVAPDAELQDTHWTGTQFLRDIAEADGWHGIVSTEAKVAA